MQQTPGNIIERNNVKVIGEGNTTLMFAHGFGCDQNTWRSVMTHFTDNFKIVVFDYVGAGKSDLSAYNENRYKSLDGYAMDVIEICDELKLTNVVFVGHSVSSMIGVLALKQRPGIFEKIVFIGPSPRYINAPGYDGGIDINDLEELLEVMDSNYLGWSKMVAPQIMGNSDRPELGEELTASFCSTDPDIARKFARVTFMSDNRDDLRYLKIPSLTIQCDDDFLTSYETADYISSKVERNNVVKLSSTGHCPHLSDPVGVVDAIRSFV